MLHTEPSFSVYADENEDGVINIEQDLLKGKEEDNSEFSFDKNMGSFDNENEYKKMVDDDPLNIVLLKNYAHHLQVIFFWLL